MGLESLDSLDSRASTAASSNSIILIFLLLMQSIHNNSRSIEMENEPSVPLVRSSNKWCIWDHLIWVVDKSLSLVIIDHHSRFTYFLPSSSYLDHWIIVFGTEHCNVPFILQDYLTTSGGLFFLCVVVSTF